MCFRRRPADHRLPHVVRKCLFELRPRVLGADDDDPRELAFAALTLEVLGDVPQVPLGELVDVALVARLRPAALVVAAGRLVVLVDQLLEAGGAEAEDLPALAPTATTSAPSPRPTSGTSGAR